MSRVVSLEQALTDEDRHYLRQLGGHGANIEARIDTAYPPDPDDLAEFNLNERKALADLNGMGLNATDQTDLLAENEKLRAELAAALAGQEPPAESVVPPSYSGWSKAQLEAEIDRVNEADEDAELEKGTVKEMTAALMEYFTE